MNITKGDALRVARGVQKQVSLVLMRKAYHEVLKERMLKMDADLLVSGEYHDEDGNRITNPENSWLIVDAECGIFYALRDAAVKADGFNVPPGHCPALIADSALTKAEHALIESAEIFFPGVNIDSLFCHADGLGNYRKYIDLLCGLVVNTVGIPKLPNLKTA